MTTVGDMYPQAYGARSWTAVAGVRRRRGRVPWIGANPGRVRDLLPLLMSGHSLRIDRISVRQISNFLTIRRRR